MIFSRTHFDQLCRNADRDLRRSLTSDLNSDRCCHACKLLLGKSFCKQLIINKFCFFPASHNTDISGRSLQSKTLCIRIAEMSSCDECSLPDES